MVAGGHLGFAVSRMGRRPEVIHRLGRSPQPRSLTNRIYEGSFGLRSVDALASFDLGPTVTFHGLLVFLLPISTLGPPRRWFRQPDGCQQRNHQKDHRCQGGDSLHKTKVLDQPNPGRFIFQKANREEQHEHGKSPPQPSDDSSPPAPLQPSSHTRKRCNKHRCHGSPQSSHFNHRRTGAIREKRLPSRNRKTYHRPSTTLITSKTGPTPEHRKRHPTQVKPARSFPGRPL